MLERTISEIVDRFGVAGGSRGPLKETSGELVVRDFKKEKTHLKIFVRHLQVNLKVYGI